MIWGLGGPRTTLGGWQEGRRGQARLVRQSWPQCAHSEHQRGLCRPRVLSEDACRHHRSPLGCRRPLSSRSSNQGALESSLHAVRATSFAAIELGSQHFDAPNEFTQPGNGAAIAVSRCCTICMLHNPAMMAIPAMSSCRVSRHLLDTILQWFSIQAHTARAIFITSNTRGQSMHSGWKIILYCSALETGLYAAECTRAHPSVPSSGYLPIAVFLCSTVLTHRPRS